MSDWLDAGGSVNELMRLAEAAPVFVPAVSLAVQGGLPQVAADPAWQDKLLRNEYDQPLAVQANVTWALVAAPELSGRLFYDEFAHQIVIRGRLPWTAAHEERAWTDTDKFALINWLQMKAGLMANTAITRGALHLVASYQKFHPVRDYLDGLKWDETPRIDTWAVTALGCENNPYVKAVSRAWLIGMVRRIRQPGCKFDTVLILFGEQGIKKSTALQTLTEPWYTDEISDLGSKDASMQVAGIWLIELAELDSLLRVEASRAKAFFSRATDRFRPPYGDLLIWQPRQCGFAGTSNEDEVLRDATGNRRYWLLGCACESADIAWLSENRDQLWAEACAVEAAGEPHWLTDTDVIALSKVVEKTRRVEDPFEAEIVTWLAKPEMVAARTAANGFTVSQVMYHALWLQDRSKWTKQIEIRVTNSLKALGFKKEHRRTGNVWVRAPNTVNTSAWRSQVVSAAPASSGFSDADP